MARRSDHTPEQLKALILSAALDVVRDDGIAALNARAVAKRIGYSVGTLYNQFESLDDIVLHANAESLVMVCAKFTKVKGGDELLEAYLAFAKKEPARMQLLLEYPLRGELPVWYKARIAESFACVEKVLRPEVGEAAAPEAARVLWAAIQGIMLMSAQGKLESAGVMRSKQLMQSMVHGYLAGMKAKR